MLWNTGSRELTLQQLWLAGCRQQAQQLCRLVVSRHVKSSQTRDGSYVPYIGRQILKPLDHQGSSKYVILFSNSLICLQLLRL